MAKAFPGPIERGCEASDNVPDAVIALSVYCETPCDVLDIPDLALDQDQRDVQLPPILPPRDPTVVSGFCRTQPGGTTTLGTQSTSSMAEDTSTWERANNATAAVRGAITKQTRTAYDGGSEIAAFFRTEYYDSCGSLISVGPEEKQTLADVSGCPEPEFDAYFGTSGNLDADQIANGQVSNEEFEALMGVVAPIQDQLDFKQDQSDELDAIAGASANGILVRVGPGSYAFRTIIVSGLSITNANGVTGDPEIEAVGAEGLEDGDKGDIIVTSTGAVWTIDDDVVTFAKMQNASSASVLVGRGAGSGAGDFQEITLGSNLALTTTVLSATPSGSDTQIQFNNSGAFGGDTALTWNLTTNALTLGVSDTTSASLRVCAESETTDASIILEDMNGGTGTIVPSGVGTDAVLTLPAESGTLARTADLESYAAFMGDFL